MTAIGRLPMKRPEYTQTCLNIIIPCLDQEDLDVRRACSFAIRLSARGNIEKVVDFLKENIGYRVTIHLLNNRFHKRITESDCFVNGGISGTFFTTKKVENRTFRKSKDTFIFFGRLRKVRNYILNLRID